jgi:hypothetical protein
MIVFIYEKKCNHHTYVFFHYFFCFVMVHRCLEGGEQKDVCVCVYCYLMTSHPLMHTILSEIYFS